MLKRTRKGIHDWRKLKGRSHHKGKREDEFEDKATVENIRKGKEVIDQDTGNVNSHQENPRIISPTKKGLCEKFARERGMNHRGEMNVDVASKKELQLNEGVF